MKKHIDFKNLSEEERLELMIEKIEQDPAYADVVVPPEVMEELFRKIDDYEKKTKIEKILKEHKIASDAVVIVSKEDKEALQLGQEILEEQREWERDAQHRKKQRKFSFLVVSISVAIVMFGTVGVVADGNIVTFVSEIYNGFSRDVVDSGSEVGTLDNDFSEEGKAYSSVNKLLDSSIVELDYNGNDPLKFQKVNLDSQLNTATFIYSIGIEFCIYQIYENNDNISHSWGKDDTITDVFEIETSQMTFEVKEYKNANTGQTEYATTFKHDTLSYVLHSSISKKEFEKLLDNLNFD